MANTRVCSIEGCDKPSYCRGWCRVHYYRWYRTGDPHTRKVVHGSVRRYIEKLARSDHSDDCVVWPFARSPSGYGILCRKVFGTASAHRVICEMVHGPAPTPVHQAAHSCGRGHLACVNPAHLRWATPKENTADKVHHGTVPRGETHAQAKLTADDVRLIRRISPKHTRQALADRFGVSESTIRSILKGKNWAHLT